MKKFRCLPLLLLMASTASMAGLPEGMTAFQAGDFKRAEKEFRPLADSGTPLAQMMLGQLYANGSGVPKDFTLALSWMQKAAEQGFLPAQSVLANIYYSGGPDSKQDYAQAARWAQKAAEQGNAPNQALLAKMFSLGQGVGRNSSVAANWYQKAAEQEFAPAQLSLGLLYARGNGVEKNYAKALEWTRKAADKGLLEAQSHLGNLYLAGSEGIAPNYDEAQRWLQKAAERGDAYSQALLAGMLSSGQGVPQDLPHAFLWAELAVKADSRAPRAIRSMRDAIYQRMSQEDMARALILQGEWQKRHGSGPDTTRDVPAA